MEEEDMSWVKIDDLIYDHPKLLAAGAEAAWIWVCGLAYCNRQKRRDGFIPAVKATCLFPVTNPDAAVLKLVEVGLWESAENGYRIHDYHEYQPAEDLRSKRSESGRKGGLQSGKSRGKKAERSNNASNNEAIASNPVPVPDPVPVPNNNFISVREAFMARYEAATGLKYPFQAKDGVAIAKLTKLGQDIALRCIENAFKDKWFLETAKSPGIILSQAGKYQVSNVVPIQSAASNSRPSQATTALWYNTTPHWRDELKKGS